MLHPWSIKSKELNALFWYHKSGWLSQNRLLLTADWAVTANSSLTSKPLKCPLSDSAHWHLNKYDVVTWSGDTKTSSTPGQCSQEGLKWQKGKKKKMLVRLKRALPQLMFLFACFLMQCYLESVMDRLKWTLQNSLTTPSFFKSADKLAKVLICRWMLCC